MRYVNCAFLPLRTNLYLVPMFQNCAARATMLDMVIEKTINVKAVCTRERHETTSSDNCDIVMIVVGISHQLLWNCCGQTVCHKVFNCKQST